MIVRFILGGLIYMGIEVLYDGTSHRSMGLVGGLSFVICSWYLKTLNINYWIMCVLMATTIVILEYIAGKIWNSNFSIWDYRKMPFNFQGQVCLTFYVIWIVIISPVIMWLDKLL